MTGSPDDQIAGPSPPPTKPRFGPHWIALGSVLVMLLFITVGLPYLIRPRSASREVNFVVSLRTINTACVTYSYTYPKRGFPPSLSALGPPQGNAALSAAAADLIDLRLANTGQKSGYRFTYRPFDHDGDGRYEAFTVNAEPLEHPRDQRHFYSDQTGVIRWEQGKPATVASPPLQ